MNLEATNVVSAAPATCPDLPSVPECIRQHRDDAPGVLCCAVRSAGRWQEYSREQFWALVEAHAARFQADLSTPTLILFAKKLDVHLLAGYIGAMLAGHIPAQISPPSSKLSEAEYRRKVTHIHEITRFGAVFTDPEVQAQFAAQTDVVIYATHSAMERRPATQVATLNPTALVQFSSGTTGLQKGVRLSHASIVQHMRAYSAALSLDRDDVVVSWLPLYHDMGLIACYLMPLLCGIPFCQMDPFDWIIQPDLLLATIEDRRPTICFLPNFAYQLLAAKGKPHDLRSIRYWINCSEPARAHSHEVFRAKYPVVDPKTLTVCYALAENTFAVTQSFPSSGPASNQGSLSCGKPIPGVEVKIFKNDGDVEGEIGVRSDFLFHEFLDGARPLDDGYYRTGDLGYVDANGELFVTGRKKDIIIVCGKNVFPQDLEYAASETEGVYPGRTVAFGIWNEEVGSEDVYIMAERKEGVVPGLLKLAIQKSVQNETGIVPKRVEIMEHMSLVKTSSGKISRSRNRELYLNKTLVPL
jgi:fatty-acyl-CoA synthase